MNEFLRENFIYFVLVVAFIILALIGYMIDKAKTNKLKKDNEEKKNEQLDIPISNATFPVQGGINTQINSNKTDK